MSLTEAIGVKVVSEPALVVKAVCAMWTKTCVCADPIIYFWFNTMVNCWVTQQLVAKVEMSQQNCKNASKSLKQ